MNTAKLIKSDMQNNSNMTIAHIASNSPFYYVEEAEIGHSKVSVTYFNESDADSELEYASVPTKELHAFIDDFYGPVVVNEVAWGEHRQTEFKMSTPEYLLDNLKEVCTDYLNAGKGVNHV